MADQSFDVVVIGGGPGGYVCAIKAAQLGLKTACVEKDATLGGTCVNVGCIPSKALLQSSHLFEEAGHGLAQHGIKVAAPGLDLAAMLARKDKVVQQSTAGIDFLFKKNKVTRIQGTGRIVKAGEVEVTAADGAKSKVTAKHIVIATGSEVTPLPNVAIDEKKIVSSTGALALPQVPKSMVVVGAGVIGLELGSVWRRLGAEVTVIEFLDRILPGMDGEVAKQMQRTLTRQGMKFRLSAKVTGAKSGASGVALSVEPVNGGAAEEVKADIVLVAIGRRPYTNGLGLKEAGIAIDNRGRVVTDGHFATSVSGIWAIGDVIEGPMLAHKSEHEGVACAELIAGQKPVVNHDVIPGVVYTWPEVAAVGRTEEELKAAGIAYKAGKFPFSANGRARANADAEGFVKVLADARTDRLLGAHVVGPMAGELIHEFAMGMVFGASSEDIGRICHAHPTLAEAVKEASLMVTGRQVNL
ncbi:dihydrolipoyl dehydrogenase [Desertibaculum subflavum]|uniref:dihydrolipoyl dehydrogenase n=1 Tax=Desertibaculum subflavum TaxID=2268458 RepID=UPI000E66FA0A